MALKRFTLNGIKNLPEISEERLEELRNFPEDFSDSECPPMTKEQLKNFRPDKSMSKPDMEVNNKDYKKDNRSTRELIEEEIVWNAMEVAGEEAKEAVLSERRRIFSCMKSKGVMSDSEILDLLLISEDFRPSFLESIT